MKYNVYLVSIVKRQGKVLLVRDSGESYHLPYAQLTGDTQPIEALKHQLLSELGIDQIAEQLFDVVSFTDIADSSKKAVYVVYTVGTRSSSVDSLNDVKYTWKKPSDIRSDTVDIFSYMILDLATHQPSLAGVELHDVVNDTTKAIIYSDGGSRGNPGPSAAAYVILNTSEQVIQQGSLYLGLTTNNQAEYQGIRIALEAALEIGIKKIEFRSDSMLVVNQLNGIYTIKNRELWPTYERIQELLVQFQSVTFRHVKREFNTLADGLVNKTLNEHATQHV